MNVCGDIKASDPSGKKACFTNFFLAAFSVRYMASGHIESQVSIGFGGESKGYERAINPTQSDRDESLDNVCCLLLYCKTHRRLVVKRMAKGLFLPYITYRSSESWRKVAQTLIKRILERLGNESNCGRGRCSETEMFNIFRVQWPKTRQFYTRITVLVRMEPDGNGGSNGNARKKGNHNEASRKADKNQSRTNCYCRVSTSSLVWMGAEDLATNSNKFWGPEVAMFFHQLQESDLDKFELIKDYADCSVRNCLRKLSKRTNNQRKAKEQLLSAKYNKQAAVRLYNEFVSHCFPSRFMNFNSFKAFMVKLGLQGEDLPRIFKAFNFKRTNYLGFNELLLGLAAMDTTTTHSGVSLEMRLSYMYRFYDSKGDNKMSLADLAQLKSDILAKNKDNDLLNSSGEVASMVSNFLTKPISNSTVTSIDLEHFVSLVAANQTICQLTNLIFRSPSNILLVIATKFDYGSTSVYANKSALASITLQARYIKTCQICRCIRFHILAEAIRVSLNGEVSRLINLQLEQQTANTQQQPVEASRDKIPFVMEIKRDDLLELALIMVNKVTSLGKQFFNRQHDTNEEAARLWYFANTAQFIDAIKKILVAGRMRLQQESKIVAVNSPCFVISGLYGNLKDLLIYGHLLWKTAPRMNKSTFVFLGNLVGPQPWSLECIVYILCMKILTPHRFIILRGMQEVQDSQQQQTNTFYKECFDRFETKEVWTLANEVFDQMPLGAVIEDKIFCTSSAFPRTRKSLQSINATLERGPLCQPLKEECVRDILSTDVFDSAAMVDKGYNGKDIFRQFCQINRLCCLIRSHPAQLDTEGQPVNPGKTFYFNYKAISLLSGSTLKNSVTSSVALVTRNHIRLVRVDTSMRT